MPPQNDKDDVLEKFHLEWENYFDDLDSSIQLLDNTAVEAHDKGFDEVAAKLLEAGTALIRHCRLCEEFLAREAMRMTVELYKQNPLLKILYEGGFDALGTGVKPGGDQPEHPRADAPR